MRVVRRSSQGEDPTQGETPPRARTSHRPYYGRAWQGASWRSGEAILTGRGPHPGRGQAIAPTMDEPGKALRGVVGAHPCGRPVGVPIRLSSPDKPMEQLIGSNEWCGER